MICLQLYKGIWFVDKNNINIYQCTHALPIPWSVFVFRATKTELSYDKCMPDPPLVGHIDLESSEQTSSQKKREQKITGDFSNPFYATVTGSLEYSNLKKCHLIILCIWACIVVYLPCLFEQTGGCQKGTGGEMGEINKED